MQKKYLFLSLFISIFLISSQIKANFIFADKNPPGSDPRCHFIHEEADQFSIPFATAKEFKKLRNSFESEEQFLNRYGFKKRSKLLPKSHNEELPVGFTYSKDKKSVHVNCFLCHTGQVNGESYEGSPNLELRIQEFVEDLSAINLLREFYLKTGGSFGFKNYPGATSANELASLAIRSQNDDGETSVPLAFLKQAFGHKETKKVPVYPTAWWLLQPGLKKTLYADGLGELNIGHIMQFTAMSKIKKEDYLRLVPNFEEILSCVRSTPIPNPKGNFAASTDIGRSIYSGELIKDRNDCACIKCHGSLDPRFEVQYTEKRFPIEKIGTDDTYFNQRTPEYLEKLEAFTNRLNIASGTPSSQMKEYKKVLVSRPLIAMKTKRALTHNQSIPTLYDLLCTPERNRSKMWRMSHSNFDIAKRDSVVRDPVDSTYNLPIYDTLNKGFSNKGHNFCTDILSANEDLCSSLIEYLEQL